MSWPRCLLLIGALLVWCCVSPPEQHPKTSQQSRPEQAQKPSATLVLRPDHNRSGEAKAVRGEANDGVDASEQHLPCSQPADRNKCELEAEWQSAESAGNAAYWAKLQAIFSGFGVAGLVATLYFAGQTARAALAAGKDSIESLKVAKSNAEATSIQIDIIRASSERQLRAYVGIESIKVRSASNGFYVAELIVNNYGLTPAYNCVVSTASRIDRFPLIDPHGEKPVPEPQTHTLTLFPTATVPAYAGCKVSDRVRELESGDVAFYIYGYVTYRDHENGERLTNFAFRGTEGSFFRTGEMHVCPGGNTAD